MQTFPNPGVQQVVIYFYSVPVATSFTAYIDLYPDKYMAVKQDGCSVTCLTFDQHIGELARKHEAQAIDLQKESLLQKKAALVASAVPVIESTDTKNETLLVVDSAIVTTEKIEGENPVKTASQ